MFWPVSRAQRSAERCVADPGPRLLVAEGRNRGPGSAVQHCVLHRVRDTCHTLLAVLAFAGTALAQPADTILLNGKIVVYDATPAEALAVRDGKIAALGRDRDIRALAGPGTRVVDLGGRTVIPGLIDSHIHAIRAGLTFQTEVHWIGVRTLAEALDRLRQKAKSAPK